VLSRLGLTLEEAVSPKSRKEDNEEEESPADSTSVSSQTEIREQGEAREKAPSPDEIMLMEFVVRPEATIVGRSAKDMQLRTRYGLNLLAVSREGRRSSARLRTLRIQPGDPATCC
jgi:Trk K+ transport system NAD-binding subunit